MKRLAPAADRRSHAIALAAGVTLLLTVALAAFGGDAFARPGGGQSYSGGERSSGSGSGGGGDGGGILNLIIFLVFEVPVIGIPLLIAFIAYFLFTKAKAKSADWSTGMPVQQSAAVQRVGVRQTLEAIRREDPNFSVVIFEDFLASLYSQFHEARGRGALDELAPYVTDALRAQLRPPLGLRQIKGIVMGAMRFSHVEIVGAQTSAQVTFEANMTEVYGDGERALYVVERWTLVRRRGARSRTPDKSRTLGCPNCGAPKSALRGTLCTSCNTPVGDGAFDWTVSGVTLVSREDRPPLLTGTVEERGNDLPTIVDPRANSGFAALQAKDPQVSWQALTARLGLAFRELQVAWSSQDLSRARPFLSDAQFQSLLYWVETYRKSGLRNVTDQTSLANVELVRVTSDAFYDAVTVRIYATGLDYTLDGQGKVVAGSNSRMRPYSEYWTLVRGSARRGAPRAEPVCPHCGAPLAVNMAGTCTYCNVVVTTGEFDWVVSRIEQDEAYDG